MWHETMALMDSTGKNVVLQIFTDLPNFTAVKSLNVQL